MAWFMLKTDIHCTSSQDQEGESLEIYCSDRQSLEQLNLRSIQEKRSWQDKRTVAYLSFPSGTMSPLSDWITKTQESISNSSSPSEINSQFVEDSPARTYPLQEEALVWMESVQVYGVRCAELLGRLDPDTYSWKTLQCSLFEDSPESLQTLPRWGMTSDGELWELTKLERHTEGTDSGGSGRTRSIPTPCAYDADPVKGRKSITTDDNWRGLGLAYMTQWEPERFEQLKAYKEKKKYPTPTCQETEHPNAILSKTGRRQPTKGKTSHSLNLIDVIKGNGRMEEQEEDLPEFLFDEFN